MAHSGVIFALPKISTEVLCDTRTQCLTSSSAAGNAKPEISGVISGKIPVHQRRARGSFNKKRTVNHPGLRQALRRENMSVGVSSLMCSIPTRDASREGRVHVRIGVAALGRRGVRPAEQAAREGRPRNRADPIHLQRREHLAFLLAVHERIVVLHRDEGRQVVCDRVVCGRVSSAAPLATARRARATYSASG